MAGFQAMFEGRDPTTGELFGRPHGRNAVPAFDVVLRPTKSVSILYGLGNPAIGLVSSSPSATAHLKNAWRPPVAVQGREGLPALELVGDEGSHVVPGDRLDRQRVAALGQEVGEQPDGLGVALDGALALVLRTKSPAEATFSVGRFPALDARATRASHPLAGRCAKPNSLLGLVG